MWTTTLSAPSTHRGGTLRIGLGSGIDSIDPAVSFSPPAWQAIANANDGLVGYRRVGGGAGAVIVPDLAVAIPTPTDGGRTYTFQVRRGVSYSTGGTVKPSDFRYAWERALKAPNGPAGYFLTSIVGAQQCLSAKARCSLAKGVVTDDAAGTVTVHLTRPDWDLLNELTLPFADAVPPGTPAPGGTAAVPATGPYEVTAYSPNHELTLGRNPHFKQWSSQAQPDGFPDRITWRLNVSGATQASLIAKGKLDAALGGAGRAGEPALAQAAASFPDQAHIYTRVSLWHTPSMPARPLSTTCLRDERSTSPSTGARRFGPSEDPAPVRSPARSCPRTSRVPALLPVHHRRQRFERRLVGAGSRPRPPARRPIRHRRRIGDRPLQQGRQGVRSRPSVSTLRSLGYHVRLIAGGGDVAYFHLLYSPAGVQAGTFAYVDDYPAPSDFLKLQLACGSPINVSHFCDPKIDAEMTRRR